MTITTTTPQAELKQLSDAAIKREFLKGTPLNLGKFLRYVLLYLLFPGMVFGFAAGIVLTAVFCLALTGILIWGDESDASVAIYSWLAAGLVVVVLVNIVVIRAGWRESKQRAAYRPAKGGLKRPVTAPSGYEPHWHEKDGFHISEMVLNARGAASTPSWSPYRSMTGGSSSPAARPAPARCRRRASREKPSTP